MLYIYEHQFHHHLVSIFDFRNLWEQVRRELDKVGICVKRVKQSETDLAHLQAGTPCESASPLELIRSEGPPIQREPQPIQREQRPIQMEQPMQNPLPGQDEEEIYPHAKGLSRIIIADDKLQELYKDKIESLARKKNMKNETLCGTIAG